MDEKKQNEVTWSPTGAFFGTLVTLIVPQILIVAIVQFFSEISVTEFFTDTPTDVLFYIESAIVVLTLTFLSMVVWSSGGKIQALGIKKLSGPATYLPRILKVLGIYLVISFTIFYLLGLLLPENILDTPQNLGFSDDSNSVLELLTIALSLVIFTPVIEELLFRGFLFKGFRKILTFWPAALISSGIFAIAHLQLNIGIDVFILAVGAAWLLEKTGSIYTSILLHGLKNAIAFVLVFVIKF